MSYGASPISDDVLLRARDVFGCEFLQVYGLTETTGICTLDDPQFPMPGYVGPAVANIEMKLGEGSESYAPLARALIGGLLVSVAFTVFLVPAGFALAYRNRSETLHPA